MYPRVSQFVDEIRAALQTEACVERSFAAQTNVIRSAPRIHSKTCNDRLFISINASRIEREVSAKDSLKVGHDVVLCIAKGNIMTHLNWKELIFTFADEEPGVDGRVTRAMQRHETAANIGVATRVSVAFRVDGALKYFPRDDCGQGRAGQLQNCLRLQRRKGRFNDRFCFRGCWRFLRCATLLLSSRNGHASEEVRVLLNNMRCFEAATIGIRRTVCDWLIGFVTFLFPEHLLWYVAKIT